MFVWVNYKMIKIINLCEQLKELRLEEIKTYSLSKNQKQKYINNTLKIENNNTNKITHLMKFFLDCGYENDLFDEVFEVLNKKIKLNIKNNSYVVYCEALIYLSKNYKKETRDYLKELKKTSNN